MKHSYPSKLLAILALVIAVVFTINCSSDDSSGNNSNTTPQLSTSGAIVAFEDTDVLSHSVSQSIQVGGNDLDANVSVMASENFKVSFDGVTYTSQITLSKDVANSGNSTVYVRFSPSESAVGLIAGNLTIASTQATSITINLSGTGISITPLISVSVADLNFEDTVVLESSDALSLVVSGYNLLAAISMEVSDGFQISLDNTVFTNTLEISSGNANDENTVYVKFLPGEAGDVAGTLTLQNDDADSVIVNLSGTGLPVVHNYITFDSERLAFGGGYNQSATQTFNLHNDLSNIAQIKMYVKLRCPAEGCDEWDVYANVKVRDVASGEMYELGRYITPYWNDNSQLERGFEFDVTDFKSLLTGSTEIRIRTECWNARGYEVTVDFDYIEGTPDFPYYEVARVIAYDDWSSSGVPYGVAHNFDLDKSMTIPANAESIHLRSIISGWGHATPNDNDGRPCAEWCYRTHDIKINGSNMFQHNLAPLGCASNPVNNQDPGNWQPDRAGWCPGMVVPARIDNFSSAVAGNTLGFEYDYEDWVNDNANGNAFYATSTFVVVKSNTPIVKPTVME